MYNKNSNAVISRDNDRIYYNITIGTTENISTPTYAIYKEQLNQAIVDNPKDYYLSVVRFTIPTQDIPIFIPQIQPFPNVNINNTVYSVTLTYNGNTSGQTFVQFVSQSPNNPVIPLSATHPEVTKGPYYYVYNYSWFLDMINTTLATAFAALAGKPVGSLAPYFQYDTTTQKISLVAQRLYYDEVLALPIKIYVNYKLSTFLDGLPYIFDVNSLLGLDVQFIVRDNYNNWYNPPYLAAATPPDYYIMTQEYDTLTDWNTFKSIALVTNLIPIIPEYVPIVNGNNNIVNSRGILKDFEPLIERGPEARTTVQYQLNGPYQLINLNSNVPLTQLDISVYWTDQYGEQYLLSVPYNQLVTIKLVFIKKSTFEGY